MKKILIVDDESVILDYLAYEFNYSGFLVYKAESGNTAINVLKNNPDIKTILSDIRMKDGDGFSLLTFANSNIKDVQFYFMSADTNISDEEISNLKLTAFFKKPFDFDEVIKMISNNIET